MRYLADYVVNRHIPDSILKNKYQFDHLTVFTVLSLGAESVDDLARMLREMGYSTKAVEQILKWYKNSNS
jgi:predicted Ser/Thr protein kinase